MDKAEQYCLDRSIKLGAVQDFLGVLEKKIEFQKVAMLSGTKFAQALISCVQNFIESKENFSKMREIFQLYVKDSVKTLGDLAEDIDTVRPSFQSAEMCELEELLRCNEKFYNEKVEALRCLLEESRKLIDQDMKPLMLLIEGIFIPSDIKLC